MRPSRTAKKRRKSGIQRRIDVGPRFDERPHDLCVPFRGGPHERGLSVALAQVVFCAAHQQCLDGIYAARPCGHHQRGFAALHGDVRISARLEEHPHDGGVAVRACQRQRRHAVMIGGIDVGARLDEQRDSFRIIVWAAQWSAVARQSAWRLHRRHA